MLLARIVSLRKVSIFKAKGRIKNEMAKAIPTKKMWLAGSLGHGIKI
jgi:hypothetical protein